MKANQVRPTKVLSRSGRAMPRRRAGFTMIELLVVIGIIVILVAILLPVAGQVRTAARVAATQQEMNKIAGAIDQYYLEFNHTYPGPLPNTAFSTNGTATGMGVPVSGMTMTENMVLGLCGGLEVPTPATTPLTPVYNSNDIQSSLGPLNLNANQAKQTRHPAFIDATPGQRMPNLPWDTSGAPPGNGITSVGDSVIPEFMDKFSNYNGGNPRPILYLRARTGNQPYAISGINYKIADSVDTTVLYNYMHLVPYTDTNAGDFYGFPGGSTTPSANSNTSPYYVLSTNTVTVSSTPSVTATATTVWDTYLGNPNLPLTPRGVNGYILISAGADGVFGTTDDLFYP